MSTTILDRQGEMGSMEQRVESVRARIRDTAEELRTALEDQIACALALSTATMDAWWELWSAASVQPAEQRQDRGLWLKDLQFALHALQETLREALEASGSFAVPLARLDELEAQAGEFPLFVRECVARWEMLDSPVPPLDPERIARARATFARGDCENLDDVLARMIEGGAWTKSSPCAGISRSTQR